MELSAVINALDYIIKKPIQFNKIIIYTDSQYVAGIMKRKDKLTKNNFITKKGNNIQNEDLVKKIIAYIESYNIEFIKVKAHLKKSNEENHNRYVDKLSRKLVRNHIKKITA